MDGFVEAGKIFKMTPALVTPLESRRTEGNIKKVQQLLLQNCHLSLQMIVDELDICQDTVRKIVAEDLFKKKRERERKERKKLCACWYRMHWLQNRTEWLQVSCKEKHYRSLPPPPPTLQIWHLPTDFCSLKWNRNLRDAILTLFYTSRMWRVN